MATKIFKGISVDKCIENASSDLNIPIDKLEYEIIDEKKGLFKKTATISVNVMDDGEAKIEEDKIDHGGGTVRIENGTIVVKDPLEGKKPAFISPSKLIKIVVDGTQIYSKKEIYEHNLVEVTFDETEAKRDIKISTNADNTEAYLTIKYTPKIICTLKDASDTNLLVLEPDIKEKIFPPAYTISEIKFALNSANITYGILEEKYEECIAPGGVENILIAKGIPTIDDESDRVEIKVNANSENKHLAEDDKGNVDFKSIGFVDEVKPGDTIATIYKGQPGQDGIDLSGKKNKHKTGTKTKMMAADGCKLETDGRIVATITGKPCVKGNGFYVYTVHEVQGDVDIKSGDIKFIGDVVVKGNVKEGMSILAGNNIDIQKNVERATIKAKGNVNIIGSAITSTIIAGGQDVKNLKQIENMGNLKNQLVTLIETVEQVKQYNLLGKNVQDGEAIKVLIENKFKLIPKCCIEIIAHANKERGQHEDKVLELVKTKLLGLGPLSIKNYYELDEILNLLDYNVEKLNLSLALPVNINLSYSQECNINSSGDIIFTGNGEYVSNIIANGSVFFKSSKSVARGGEIRAKNEIWCKNVGSTGGVSTKLCVEKKGQIWAEVAYQNTQIIIGARKYDFEYPSRDVHAFLNEKGDIVVESLRL